MDGLYSYFTWRLLPVLLVLSAGCTLGYQHDSRFQRWLLTALDRCEEQNGELPAMSEDERQAFMKLSYDAYYGEIAREFYADKLGVRYPNHELTVYCLVNAFPALPNFTY